MVEKLCHLFLLSLTLLSRPSPALLASLDRSHYFLCQSSPCHIILCMRRGINLQSNISCRPSLYHPLQPAPYPLLAALPSLKNDIMRSPPQTPSTHSEVSSCMLPDVSFLCVVKTQRRWSKKIYKTELTKTRYNNQVLGKYRVDPQRAGLTLIAELTWSNLGLKGVLNKIK